MHVPFWSGSRGKNMMVPYTSIKVAFKSSPLPLAHNSNEPHRQSAGLWQCVFHSAPWTSCPGMLEENVSASLWDENTCWAEEERDKLQCLQGPGKGSQRAGWYKSVGYDVACLAPSKTESHQPAPVHNAKGPGHPRLPDIPARRFARLCNILSSLTARNPDFSVMTLEYWMFVMNTTFLKHYTLSKTSVCATWTFRLLVFHGKSKDFRHNWGQVSAKSLSGYVALGRYLRCLNLIFLISANEVFCGFFYLLGRVIVTWMREDL